MPIRNLAIVLSLILMSSGCVGTDVAKQNGHSQENSNVLSTNITAEDIDRNRSKWRENGSPDYDMTVRLRSHSPVPAANAVKIRVREGKSIGIEIVDRTGTNVTSLYSDFETIEMIFDLIGTELSNGSRVKAEFDEMLGYPSKLEVAPQLSNANYRLFIDEVRFVEGKMSGRETRFADLPDGVSGEQVFSFLDSRIGWVASGPNIWMTEDGGRTWTPIRSATEDESGRNVIDRMAFRDRQNGWATMSSGLFRTQDGGRTWTGVSPGDGFNGFVSAISVLGTGTILIGTGERAGRPAPVERALFAYSKSVFRLENKSGNWVRTNLVREGNGQISRLEPTGKMSAVAIGEELGDVFYSIDDGRSWKRSDLKSPCIDRDSFPKQDFKPIGVGALPGGDVWVSYTNGMILKSEDYGATFCTLLKAQDSPGYKEPGLNYFDRFCFKSRETRYAKTGSGDIYATKDAGKSWSRLEKFRVNGLFRIEEKCICASDALFRLD